MIESNLIVVPGKTGGDERCQGWAASYQNGLMTRKGLFADQKFYIGSLPVDGTGPELSSVK